MARAKTRERRAARELAGLLPGGRIQTIMPMLAVSFLCAACQALGVPDILPTRAPVTIVTPLPVEAPTSLVEPQATPASDQSATSPAIAPTLAASPVPPAKIVVVQAPT